MKSSIYSLSFKEGALYPDKAKNGTGAQIPPNFKYADTNTRTAFFFQGTNSLSVIIFGFCKTKRVFVIYIHIYSHSLFVWGTWS